MLVFHTRDFSRGKSSSARPGRDSGTGRHYSWTELMAADCYHIVENSHLMGEVLKDGRFHSQLLFFKLGDR